MILVFGGNSVDLLSVLCNCFVSVCVLDFVLFVSDVFWCSLLSDCVVICRLVMVSMFFV